jgi:hypothetical protein
MYINLIFLPWLPNAWCYKTSISGHQIKCFGKYQAGCLPTTCFVFWRRQLCATCPKLDDGASIRCRFLFIGSSFLACRAMRCTEYVQHTRQWALFILFYPRFGSVYDCLDWFCLASVTTPFETSPQTSQTWKVCDARISLHQPQTSLPCHGIFLHLHLHLHSFYSPSSIVHWIRFFSLPSDTVCSTECVPARP